MFYTEVTGRDGRFLGRIAVRDDIDEELPLSPCSIDSVSSPKISDSELLRRRAEMPFAYSIPNRQFHYEAGSATRPVDWPSLEHDAIQQWRGMTGSSLPNNQPRAQQHEDRLRGTNSLDSDADFSGSEDSASSKKKRDVTGHLKYLVRGFLKLFHATASATNDGKEEILNKECFIPSPKVTFLIDKPESLICQICQQTSLKLAITAEDPGPDLAAIFPCGHICCHGCASLWLADRNSCPFCRIGMTHKRCGHQVEPRLIAQDTIHTLPETLANDGKIGDVCFKCGEKERREISIQRWTKLAEKFKTARHEAENLGTDDSIVSMRKAQKEFERIPEDDFWILTRMRHHQW
ncbi:hypothetical protein GGS24DRAFT_474357 [Hypoxylon argillaceum]|nr:hypothetical protein GGS24DRAFT_474357 [Hypoxylon argillaceum]